MLTNQQANPRTVVITGASSGIGEACALHLDTLGFRVFASVRREADGATLQHKASKRLTTVLLDVTDAASIMSATDIVATAVGETGLAGLVNNAGITVAGPLEFLPVSELRRQLEVNVIGQVAVTQAFLPLLRRGQGRIVNMGSLAGRVATPFIGPYHASKFAMEALTDSLRMELRRWGMRVSLIEPGFIATPLWEKSIAASNELLDGLPPQAHELYGPAFPAVRKLSAYVGKTGSSVDGVAKAVEHALTAARPKTRYLVGRGAFAGAMVFARLPDWVRDFLVARVLSRYS